MQYTDFARPENECSDYHCPYHGSLKVHGRRFEGIVVSAKNARTVSVAWTRLRRLKKYDRFIKEKTKVLAHNPDCVSAKINDKVVIYETRPISRWKRFVVVRKS
ncbi:30S ribosomal protein S17 [Candidatus Parvarchaeota archaeon]|nr:30S ribosomal protein S17 [Candidatus Parvarchaeota archaeon]